jgi:S1-C subfamily serine protease
MTEDNRYKWIIATLFVIVILIVASNIIIYKRLKQDYDTKFDEADQRVDILKSGLTSEIQKEKAFSIKERESLENRTLTNFNDLLTILGKETSRLRTDIQQVKSDTESELEGITEQVDGLEERNSELEDLISDIDVTSSDFSNIVGDVIKAVVSVKTDKGQGSGVIFNNQGYIITNKHVIDGASSVYVVDYNSNNYNVDLVGAASNIDLAVLKIISDNTFDYLNFADSSDIKIGERVIAVGNPLGLSFSVTEGIISAVNRVIDDTGVPYVQTDVPINPGNSGGPLVNSNKKIVGINTVKILDTEGIGFAIPSSIAKDIADQAMG